MIKSTINYIADSFKLRVGFSLKTQLKFISMFNDSVKLHPCLDNKRRLNMLNEKFPYICAVIKKRLNDGCKWKEAIFKTIDPSFHLYIIFENEMRESSYRAELNAPLIEIFTKHYEMLLRRTLISYLMFIALMLGFVLQVPSLIISSSFVILLLAFVCKPILSLHTNN